MSRLDKEHSGVMDTEGQRVRARRKWLGMTQDELAEEAHVNRDTLGAIEGGKGFRRSSLTKIEVALDRLEEASGKDAPLVVSDLTRDRLVEFRVEGVPGVDAVVVKGPIEDVATFEASIARILRQVQSETGESD